MKLPAAPEPRQPRLFLAPVVLLVLFAAQLVSAQESGKGPRILHLPPDRHLAEQGILTTIPIELRVPESVQVHRVLVHYKIRGTTSWTTLELVRSADAWQGAIPCLEVSTVTGDVKYYIRVHNRSGKVVAYSGTRHTPYRVLVVHDSARSEVTQDRPSCPDPADCPAGLPGCPSEVVEKIPCHSDSDCEADASCAWNGFCEVNQRRHTWLSMTFSQEFGLIDTTGACSLASQEGEGTLCRRRFDDAIYYGSMAYTNEPKKLGLGNARLAIGFERLVNYDTTLRARLAYAVSGQGPTAPSGISFVPLAAEFGVLHWFGDDPFARIGWRPFIGIAIGYGMFDIESSAHVHADVTRYDPQGGNDLDQTVDLWKRAGDAFISLGGGVALASHSGWALKGEFSVAKTFPFSAVILAPRLGVEKGF